MITISQYQTGVNAYFIPNADGCSIDLTPIGEINNFECVDDPIDNPDGDSTYIYSSATDEQYDLYELPNHTFTADVINYVQVYARAKSYEYSQSIDGIYKIILTDNACTNIYKSDDIELMTGYATYKNIWTVNPRTLVAWTDADIDNLEIGIECSSPSLGGDGMLTLRPDAVGDNTGLSKTGCVDNYQCVDETISDGNTTYVYRASGVAAYDLYNITTDAELVGKTITSVSVFATMKRNTIVSPGFSAEGMIGIKTGGNEFWGSTISLTTTWTIYSETWNNNPDTGIAWTKADIDALQIGCKNYLVGAGAGETHAATTQMYVIINYTSDVVNPQIRTTQVYAKVNYDGNVECSLQNPEEVSQDQGQKIKMLNFWSGNRVVYGEYRTNKTVVLRGKEWNDSALGINACDRMECIRNMAELGAEISLSGVQPILFDKEYRIISFGYKKISDLPKVFDWILELEFAE